MIFSINLAKENIWERERPIYEWENLGGGGAGFLFLSPSLSPSLSTPAGEAITISTAPLSLRLVLSVVAYLGTG